MKRLASPLLFAAAALLAGCGSGGDGNGSAPSAPAGSVKAVAAPAGSDWTQQVRQTPEGGFVMGNPDAPLKLVEYGSRLCPTCGALAREGYDPLTKNYVNTGKVSFEFREFMVHGPADFPPALLGNCVDKAAFFPVLEQMFHDQAQFDDGLTKMTPAQQQALQGAKPVQVFKALADAEGIIPYMKQRGLTQAKIDQCMTDQAMIDKFTKTTQDKTADGTVKGTPTVLINGKVADNAITWPQVEAALKAAGA